jgi:type I restriction enzyme, S subunit
MGVKEGYKQAEFGVIPEDWEVVKLSDLTTIIGDGIHATPNYTDRSGYYFINGNNLSDGEIVFFEGTKQVSFEEYANYKKNLNDKTILLSINGTIGNLAYYNNEVVIIGKSVCYINIKQSTNEFFIYYQLHSKYVGNFYDNELTGSTIKNLSLNSIRNTPIVLPKSQDEQKAIATALSDIDGLINSLTKLIEKKKNIKQGAMQELLTGKKRLDGFSGEWVFRTMGNLFKFSGGYSASREQLSTEGYSYLHYGDIHGSAKTFVDIKHEYLEIPKLNIELNKISKDKLLQDGDIVFVDASEDDEGVSRHVVIRNTQSIPFISGLHTIVAKSKTSELDNLYKEFCFQSQELKKQFSFYAAGIKVSGISRSNIIKIVLKIPPTIEEQTAIATILSDMDSETETLQAKLNKYKAIKQSMMQELLTGRIRLLEGA